MAHGAMYQLQAMLRQQIYEMKNEAHGLRYKADNLDFQRLNKEKQLEVLTEQIAKAEEYDRQQWELAQEQKS